MSTTTYQTGSTLAGRDTNNDPFHDPIVIGIGVVVAVVTLAMLAIGGVHYWGQLYDTPPWGAHSFPPPLTY